MCFRRFIYLYLFLFVSINNSYASNLDDFKWCKSITLEENVNNAGYKSFFTKKGSNFWNNDNNIPYWITSSETCKINSKKVSLTNVVKFFEGKGKNQFCYLTSGKSNQNILPYFLLKKSFNIKCDKKIETVSYQNKNPSNRPLASVSDSTVCYNATTTSNGNKAWNDRNENFVGEAKYRGLDCGVKEYVSPVILTSKFNEDKLALKSNKYICNFAVNPLDNSKWSAVSLEYVKEAKRRGLDCGVKNDNKAVVASSPKIKSSTNAELEKAKREAEELRKKLAALEKQQKEQQQTKPKPIVVKKPKSEFPLKPIPINFPSVSVKRDDIAVIIGNANYKKMGKDIPNVNPAYADAEGVKQYFMKAKGIKEGNIIYLKDATGAQLLGVFGNEKSHKGKLFNYIKPNKSNVYIYYAGHGAPGKEGDAYLVPTDTDSQTIEFTGYPLSTLYSNLGKLPAKSMTVILEACFSGGSQSGSLISRASPIVIQPKKTFIPNNIKVIAAGSERQMASWEEDSSHSLFTKYFLKAMSGEGDSNKDGKVSDNELKEYLSDTMTYYARRYYGRDQKVQIHNGG